jgi:hypothetical protein
LNDSLPISYAHMEVLLTGNDGKIVDAGDEEGEGEGGRESKGRVEISYLYRYALVLQRFTRLSAEMSHAEYRLVYVSILTLRNAL